MYKKYVNRLNLTLGLFILGSLLLYRRWGGAGIDMLKLSGSLVTDSRAGSRLQLRDEIPVPVEIIRGTITHKTDEDAQTSTNSEAEESSIRRVSQSQQKTCKKNNHFALIKIEKTGSSTLFSILARYIMTNKLNVMVMTKGGHIDVSAARGQHPGWDIGPMKEALADAVVHHARYNKTLFHSVMHPDTKYITLVRDAPSWFQSAIRFWPGQVKFKSPDETLLTPDMFYQPRSLLKDEYNGQKTLFHLSQLQWLGFDYSQHGNMTAIQEYIQQTVSRFHLGFLTDQFDASLILLKRDFCWDHADIFYKAQEVGGRRTAKNVSSLLPLTKQGVLNLLTPDRNLGDQLLYEAFNETWWSGIHRTNDSADFWEEVNQFKANNKIVTDKCFAMRARGGEFIIPQNRWSVEIKLNKQYCMNIYRENYRLIRELAEYAIGRFNYDPNSIVKAKLTK